MTKAVTVIENTTFSNVQSWVSANLSTGSATELTFDIHMTAAANPGFISIYRVAPTSILEILCEIQFSAPGMYAFDLGHFDLADGSTPNINAFPFGAMIQVQINSPGLFSGTCSIKGKGTA